MNRFAKGIISEFMSVRNRDALVDTLLAKFNYDVAVARFLREHIGTNMEHFAESITQEILTSSPLPGVTMLDQLICYNAQFMLQESKLISDAVLELVDETAQYTVSDGISTTRYGQAHYNGKPDDILRSWWSNSGRTAQARDDAPADLTINTYNAESALGDPVGHHTGVAYQNGYRCSPTATYESMRGVRENVTNGPIWANPYTTAARPYNSGVDSRAVVGEYGANGNVIGGGPRTWNNGSHGQQATNDPSSTRIQYPLARAPVRCGSGNVERNGITFSDQSDLGTSNHVAQYENTSYKVWLNNNKTHLPHETMIIGDSNPIADQRLLSRRVFRSNFATDGPVENAIPNYELRLQRRALDRDISETLHNAEKGCIVLGHDMSTLRDRLNKKQHTQARYNPASFPSCYRVQNPTGRMGQPRQYTQIAGDVVPGNYPRVTDDARYC